MCFLTQSLWLHPPPQWNSRCFQFMRRFRGFSLHSMGRRDSSEGQCIDKGNKSVQYTVVLSHLILHGLLRVLTTFWVAHLRQDPDLTVSGPCWHAYHDGCIPCWVIPFISHMTFYQSAMFDWVMLQIIPENWLINNVAATAHPPGGSKHVCRFFTAKIVK